MKKLLHLAFFFLIISCVFDPADKMFHMKLPLFCVCWVVMLIKLMVQRRQTVIPFRMLLYLLLILLLPMLSITYYKFLNVTGPDDSFQYLKAYLFITFTLVLYWSSIDITTTFCYVLSVLSAVIIAIFFLISSNPTLFGLLFEFGQEYGCLALGQRQYGTVVFKTIFYKTSPMIAISIAYFVFMTTTQRGANKILYLLLAALNIFAMYLAGTRNNIIVAVCLPLLIVVARSRHAKTALVSLLFIAAFISTFFIGDVLKEMFDPSDVSNAVKIAYLNDYREIFSNPVLLFFGQGLGSYNYWTVLADYTSVTELTFFEIFRNFGLIAGSLLLLLILYPLRQIRFKKGTLYETLLFGYGSYLLMSFSNPFLFSSSGMLVLSMVVSKGFTDNMHKEWRYAKSCPAT